MIEKIQKNRYLLNLSIFLTIFSILFFLRVDLIHYNMILNPDEGQFIAGAIRMLSYGFNFDSVYTGSSGPLNIILLTWPSIFNLDINIATARLTELFLTSISIFLVFLALRKFSNISISFFLISPLLVFYVTSSYGDFIHYSGEKLPITLLLLSFLSLLYLLEMKYDNPKFFFLSSITAFILGMIPFSKIQATPIALGMGFYLIYLVLTRKIDFSKKMKCLFFVLTMAFIPLFLFLIPLAINGAFLDFYYPYINLGMSYVAENLDFIMFVLLTMFDDHAYEFFRAFLGSIFILTIIYLFMGLFKNNRNNKVILLTFFVSFLSYLSIITPGKLFPHYLIFIQYFVVILFSILVFSIYEKIKELNYKKVILLSKVCLFLFISIVNARLLIHDKREFKNLELDDSIVYKRELFKWLEPTTNDTLLMWGWMCQFYVDTNLVSTTREAVPYTQMYNAPKKEFFIERYMNDFKKNKPNYIVDAVSKGSFNFNKIETQSIKINEELFNTLKNEYMLLSKKEKYNSCPRVYLKKEKFKALSKKLIPVKKIYSNKKTNENSLSSLDDNIVFETCKDNWTLDNGILDEINFEFLNEEPVSRILILNTKNAQEVNKATKELKIKIYDKRNKLIYSEEKKINKYPQWTEIKFDKSFISNKIVFEIKSFYAEGAGLNEVKFYRE